MAITTGSNQQNWRTQPFVFWFFNEYLGNHFNLDAAADDRNHLCPEYYTEEDDALLHGWGSRTWVNPPFDYCLEFAQHAIQEAQEGNRIHMLMPHKSEQPWYGAIVNSGMLSEEHTFDGRLAYIDPRTLRAKSGAFFASTVLVLGGERSDTTRLFHHSQKKMQILFADRNLTD